MAEEGYILGTSGEEISLTVDGIKIMALQKFTWKASQKKSLIRGAGYAKPHAVGRGPKDFQLDFEVKELNKAVIEEPANSPKDAGVISRFKVGSVEFTDILDLRNMTILALYPAKNGQTRQLKFTGVEFTEVSGSFSFDDEAVGRKLSAIASDAEGLI